MAQKVTLKSNDTNEVIYPQTLVDSVQNEDGDMLSELVLMKDNTTAFTPTSDYQPATKKYVDDHSGGSGGGAVNSVNGKTGTVVLNKSDIGLGNVDNVRQYSESNPPPYPVTSVNGYTGTVTLNDVKYTEQTLTDVQKTQARANIGAGTSSFSGNYNDLSNKPTIPTVNNGVLTIQKNGADVVTFGANSSDNATANITVPTKTSDLANDSNYITSSGAPVQSVNGKTGEVVLSSSDVGAISTGDISQTLGTSTTKVPSEKAVSDALSSAGAGDMLKSAYDPNNVVADAGGIVDYVDANGGKIDTIKVNGTAQEIADKTVDINVPTNTNQLTNGAGFITSSQAPVQSVNGKTGNVELTKSDIELNNVANERQYSAENPPPYPVTSVNGMTGDVNIEVAGGGVNIVLSATQPTDLKAGDYWYQIIT